MEFSLCFIFHLFTSPKPKRTATDDTHTVHWCLTFLRKPLVQSIDTTYLSEARSLFFQPSRVWFCGKIDIVLMKFGTIDAVMMKSPYNF